MIPSRNYLLKQGIHRWMQFLQLLGKMHWDKPIESHIWRNNDDWDVVCILDACRVDILEGILNTNVPTISSGVSMSRPWYELTFASESTPDLSKVALITGNPWASIVDPDQFAYFHFQEVEMTKYGIETVNPETLTERAIDVWRTRCDHEIEKLIIHYMQPHVPLRSRAEWFTKYLGKDNWGGSVMRELATGNVADDEFIEAYRDNTIWVLEDGVSKLADNCSGDIIVTADHATGLGEWGIYGHPPHIPFKFIQEVPWLSIESEDNKTFEVATDAPTHKIDTEQQLKSLGYISK